MGQALNLPPLPDGFELEGQPTVARNTLPPIPDGFEMENEPKVELGSWSKTMQARGADLADVVNRYKTGEQTLPETIFQGVVKSTFGTASDVAGEAIAPVVGAVIPDVIKEDFALTAQQLMQTQTARGIQDKWNSLSERQKANIESLGLLPVGFLAKAGINVAKPAIKASSSAVGSGLESVGKGLKNISEDAITGRKDVALKEMALPNLTPSEKAYRAEKGLTTSKAGGRVTEYELDDAEKFGIDVLKQSGIKPSRSSAFNRNIVDKEIEKRSTQLVSDLEKRNLTPFDKSELLKKLDEVEQSILSNESIGLSEQPIALKTVQEAKFLLEKRPDKIYAKDVLEVRKRLDKVMNTKKKIEKQNAALYNASLKDTRDSLNSFIAEKVPTVEVKQSLKEQSGLLAIRDSLISKAKDDPSSLGEWAYSKTIEKIPQRGDVGKIALASGIPAGLLYASGLTAPVIGAVIATGYLGRKAAPYVGKAVGSAAEKTGKALKSLSSKPESKPSYLALPAPDRDIIVDRDGVARKASSYSSVLAEKTRSEADQLGLTPDISKNLTNLSKKDFLSNRTNVNNPLIKLIAENPNAKLQDFYGKDLSDIFTNAEAKDLTKIDSLWPNTSVSDKQKVIQMLESVDDSQKKKTIGTVINILDKNKDKTELGLKLKEALKQKIKEN